MDDSVSCGAVVEPLTSIAVFRLRSCDKQLSPDFRLPRTATLLKKRKTFQSGRNREFKRDYDGRLLLCHSLTNIETYGLATVSSKVQISL